MKRLMMYLLALCLLAGCALPALGETVATPTDLVTPTPVVEITATPDPTPTAEVTPTPEPTPTEQPTPTPVSGDYGSGPLYVLENGFKHYGTPEELIPLDQTMYLYDTGVIELKDMTLEDARKLSFALDPEVFTDERDRVYLSETDPNGVLKEDVVFLWAGREEEPTPAPTEVPTPTPTAEPTSVPTAEPAPTAEPTAVPTAEPTAAPQAAKPSFSGSSRSSSSGRTVSHAASKDKSLAAYNGVALTVPQEAMTQLEVGGEQLELQLLQDGEQAAFTAVLAASTGEEDAAPDALVLTADGPEGGVWQFTGQVCKVLEASGVETLVLRSGDRVTALPAAGFTAGYRYGMYRAQGLPSKEFLYTLRMEADDMYLSVSVDGQTYDMSEDPAAAFYYYDVFTGEAEAFALMNE